MRNYQEHGNIKEESEGKWDIITHINIVKLYVWEMIISSEFIKLQNIPIMHVHVCIKYSYNVYEIGDPYLTYKINVTVQQLDYQERSYKKGKNQKLKDIWYTVGYAEIGPERMGQNTDQNQVGKTSGPKVYCIC